MKKLITSPLSALSIPYNADYSLHSLNPLTLQFLPSNYNFSQFKLTTKL
jgi:hypothetical protein